MKLFHQLLWIRHANTWISFVNCELFTRSLYDCICYLHFPLSLSLVLIPRKSFDEKSLRLWNRDMATKLTTKQQYGKRKSLMPSWHCHHPADFDYLFGEQTLTHASVSIVTLFLIVTIFLKPQHLFLYIKYLPLRSWHRKINEHMDHKINGLALSLSALTRIRLMKLNNRVRSSRPYNRFWGLFIFQLKPFLITYFWVWISKNFS